MKHVGVGVSSRWMPSWSKQELHSVPWHGRPVHWLGLMSRASFFPSASFPDKSTLSSTEPLPQWRKLQEKMGRHPRLSLPEKERPHWWYFMKLWERGKYQVGVCFVWAAVEVGRYLARSHTWHKISMPSRKWKSQNMATLLTQNYHYSKILWCIWNFAVVRFCQNPIIRKHHC